MGFGREVVGGIVVTSSFGFVFGELDEETGFLFRLLDGGFASGLQRSEFGRVLFDGAAAARLIGGEELEAAALVVPGAAQGESGLGFGVGVAAGVGIHLEAEGENGIFAGAGAVEAPVVLGDGLGEGGFQSAEGFQIFADSFTVLLEGRLVFRSLDDDLAGEAVGGRR